jgi:hypothetical protein
MTNAATPQYEMALEIYNAGDRVFLRSLLDAADIDFYIQGDTVAPYLFHSVPMRLMVRGDQLASVRRLLKRFVQSSAYAGLKRVLDDA